jgi:DNA repair protein RadD
MAERDRLIQGLATGEIEILVSCDLISEGLDVPSVGAIILLRPTESLALAMQQIGRWMRPAEGKAHLCVLDHAGNCLNGNVRRRIDLESGHAAQCVNRPGDA